MKSEDRNMETNADTIVKLASAQALLQQSAEYVAIVQPQLDKYAEFKDVFSKRAAEVAGVLVDRGIIPSAQSATLLQKFASDPTKALDMITHLARLVGPDELGKQASIRPVTGRKLGPFEALCLTGDSANTQVDSPAMVD